MADYSHLSDEELEQISNSSPSSNYSGYSDSELEQIASERGNAKGFSGVGADILQGIENAPGALWSSLKELPGELYGAGKQVLTNPKRAAQNILGGVPEFGHGLLNTPGNIRDYLVNKDLIGKETPSLRLPESIVPREFNYQEALGRQGSQPGDVLLSSAIPAASFGALGELGAVGKGFGSALKQGIKRTGAGGLYGVSENQNPITSGLVNAMLPKALETLSKVPAATINTVNKTIHPIRTAKNASDALADKLANMALNYARRNEKTGASLNPEDTAQNIEKNYTNITGEQMPVDLGTAINNKVLKSIYKINAKIPLSGGKQKISQFEKERLEREAHNAKTKYESEVRDLQAQQFQQRTQQDYATQLLNETAINEQRSAPGGINYTEGMQPYQDALQSHINAAPNLTSQLRHPENAHSQVLKNATQNAYNEARAESNALYAPVNELPTEPLHINSLSDFPRYAENARNLHIQSGNLQEMFGNDRDIGARASQELHNAIHLFTNEAPINNIGALREHIQNLQKIGAQLTENGHRVEGSRVSRLGRSLKDDLIARMRQRGFNAEADALEAADRHYISQVLPFYANRTIRHTARSEFIPEPTALSKILHNENNRSILQRLPLEAQRATAYEAITKGKYGTHETDFTPEKLAQNYASLPNFQRQAIHQISPEVNQTLSELPRIIRLNERVNRGLNETRAEQERLRLESENAKSKAFIQHEKASESIKNLDEQQKIAKENLQKVIDKKLGKPEVKSEGLGSGLRNLSPIHAGGLGFAMSAFLSPFVKASTLKHLLEAGIVTIPLARSLNKALTRAQTTQHYIEGTKYEKKPKNESKLGRNIKTGAKGLHYPALGVSQEKRKPLELELTKSAKDYK